MDIHKHMQELLVQYIAGKLDDLERIQAKNWIDESDENRQYFEEIKKYYQLTKLIKKPGGFNKEEGWERVKEGYRRIYLNKIEDLKSAKRLLIRRYMIPVAASIMAALFIGTLSYQFIFEKKVDNSPVLCEINVPMGSKSQVRLPDSSVIWINAGSKLSYFTNSFMENRMVMLEGEAYFDVMHIDNNQFVVRTSDVDVKVYGTQFNIKSYPEESVITTTLVSGKVAMEWNQSSKFERVFLEPNHVARFNKSKIQDNKNALLSEYLKIEANVSTKGITSWKDNEWVIESEELDDLAILLERRFNVKIAFEDESLKKYKFSGTLKEETLEQMLKIIQLSAPILFTIMDNKVTIHDDPSFRKKYDSLINVLD